MLRISSLKFGNRHPYVHHDRRLDGSGLLLPVVFLYNPSPSTMSKAHPPELKKFMDKRMCLQLNGNRKVSGILRGFDPFMNLVIDECVELRGNERQSIGMVVIRGNSIIMLEALERVV
ncbi:small nuclear ribonucleoprotein G-like [Branchiostoma floridae]|uniref:Small nuclear ribonucleoprotein G n=2 Tax=Branchiostoma TaxID=7737 RepID=A0A9J7MME6_BRAFL|nr:small nuclear ribonucleoprotein G-like [Branchiostoma floridae]